MRAIAGLLIRSFFRSVEVENRDGLPIRTPAMVVASHRNGLVDGLLLMVAIRRYPRFLGKSTLFKIPPLWPLLKLAGVVPVFRAADGPSTQKNTATFAASRRILGDGGLIAVFPEGISHDALRLQTLRTGAARIALGATVEDNVKDWRSYRSASPTTPRLGSGRGPWYGWASWCRSTPGHPSIGRTNTRPSGP
jgi:1-acyl-sn-glycerol-3-phosphate acyltransferase